MSDKKTVWTIPVFIIGSAVLCCTLWGSATPTIKIAYELFRVPANDTASRLVLAGARFIITGIMTILFGSLLQRKLLFSKKESWGKIFILSLFQ